MKKLLITSCLFFILLNTGFTQTSINYIISKWLNNKEAAVSLTFDDLLPSQLNIATPYLDSKNIDATLFIITSKVGYDITWNQLQASADSGHEIASHTVTAPEGPGNYLTDLDSSQIYDELANSYNAIKTNIDGQNTITIGWPSGKGGGSSDADQLVRRIADDFYVGARNADVPGDYNNYDEYTEWSGYTNYYLQVKSYAAPKNSNDLSAKLDECINIEGWTVVMYHGIDDGSWGALSEPVFKAQIDSLKSKEDKLWIAPFNKPVRYHKQRRAEPQLTKKSEDSETLVLNLTDTLSDNSKYNQPLTIRMEKPSWQIYGITQNSEEINVIEDGDSIQFNAIPDGGDIVLNKNSETGKSEKRLNGSVKIYPNPAKSKLNIESSEEVINVSIIDITGKTILKEIEKNTIDLSGLEEGIYFIKIETIKISKTIRFSVSK